MKNKPDAPLLPQWVIEKKRDGQVLGEREIRWFIDGFTRGTIADYQMSALAMAIYLRGMTPAEVAVLTDAMMRSGDLVDTSSLRRPKVDKHSTGGIGDKVSLILGPLAAACGLDVPMISGRGLGITGGTLDKLESIPGYRTNLTEKQFLSVIRDCGCSIIGQTARLAPADKKLYALRDVTATVPSIPLITASIMCKKLAEGIDGLVLDVKWGQGAFMQTLDQARDLARSMVRVGRRMGKGMTALLTDMNQPLGRAAGNALEVIESIETLQGRGPRDLTDLTVELTAEMLLLGRVERTKPAARRRCRAALADGAAWQRFRDMVHRQGGDLSYLDDPARFPRARLTRDLPAPRAGWVARADAESIGRACLILGAGRTRTDQAVDFAVGATGIRKIGEPVRKGEPLLTLHANDEAALASALALLPRAFVIAGRPVRPPPLVHERITG
jgi:pyrimidine-nucleoside phosphorylase